MTERLANISGNGAGAAEDLRQTLRVIAKEVEAGPPLGTFLVQDEAQTVCILIEVISEPRVAPDARASFGGESREMATNALLAILSEKGALADDAPASTPPGPAGAPPPGPLIVCRFGIGRKSDIAQGMRLLQSSFMRADGLKSPGMRPIPANLDELALLEQTLRASAARVAPAARARVPTADGLWTLGFLGVPTPAKDFVLAPEVSTSGFFPCSSCGVAASDKCGSCRGAVYCSRECQRRDWKVHKLVCNGSTRGSGAAAAPLPCAVGEGGAAGGAPPSVRIDLRISSSTAAPCVLSLSLSGGPSTARGPVDGAPLNRHGAAHFVVKVQLPLSGSGEMMVYDELRSFTSLVPLSQAPTLAAAVRTHGVRGGIKAYFRAVREGDFLRVFTEPLAPLPW